MPTHRADLAVPKPWRESLRRSQERRDAARRARRRRFRSRGVSFVLASVMVLGGGAALAADGGSTASKPAAYAYAAQSAIVAAQQKLGVAADGVVGPQTRRAVRRFQRRNGLIVDGIIGPQTLAALGISAKAAAPKRKKAGAGSVANAGLLQKIAQCESGGNPGAVSPDGRYRGKYQFSRETWRAVGGTGDPAAASEGEQDRRAAILLQRAGPSSWPNCA